MNHGGERGGGRQRNTKIIFRVYSRVPGYFPTRKRGKINQKNFQIINNSLGCIISLIFRLCISFRQWNLIKLARMSKFPEKELKIEDKTSYLPLKGGLWGGGVLLRDGFYANLRFKGHNSVVERQTQIQRLSHNYWDCAPYGQGARSTDKPWYYAYSSGCKAVTLDVTELRDISLGGVLWCEIQWVEWSVYAFLEFIRDVKNIEVLIIRQARSFHGSNGSNASLKIFKKI